MYYHAYCEKGLQCIADVQCHLWYWFVRVEYYDMGRKVKCACVCVCVCVSEKGAGENIWT
jgi:hypothetical protein